MYDIYADASTVYHTKPEFKTGLTVEGDLTVNGRSFSEFVEKVESRLALLVPNPALEDEFEELRALKEQYVELERKLLDQKKVWDIMKTV